MDPLAKFISLTDQLAAKENFPPPVVAVMGSFNTGKSTLINNLLNEQVCPEDSLPKTACFFYLKYGEKFVARAQENGRTLCFPTKKQFSSFLNNKTAGKLEKVEITLKHPLLKKCTLVDTPGIDASSSEITELEKLALQADKILYLFHQRGIDELNKNFLTKLAKRKKIGHRDISFWINCNLGKSDGTSLQNTEQILKSIFSRSPEIYLINSHAPESIETLRRYIEVVISKEVIHKLSAKHKKMDEKIPARIQKSLLIQDDVLFLDTFWNIKNTAEKILLSRSILNDLPLVESQIKNLLAGSQNVHLPAGINSPVSRPGHHESANIPEIKNQMSALAKRMMHDTRIKHIISPREIGKWAGTLNREEFRVVAVGGFSSGKSTFFNAIMGEHILPAENRPTTSSITYIRHGPKRKATVIFKPRLTLKLCIYEDSAVKLNQEELQAAEEWLAQDSSLRRIMEVKIDTGKGFIKADKSTVLKEIKRTKKIFSSGLRNGSLDQREAGALFRPVPAWKAKAMGPVWEVTLTFAPVPPVELDLETTKGKNEFQSLTTSTDALRIQDINITHPTQFLKLATFVDTPGLASTHRHHSALTTDFLQHSDAYLFFLNGKHILNKSDSRSLLDIFKLRLQDYLHTEETSAAVYEMAKFFFIINFADTLTSNEREKVRNFLRKNVTMALKESGFNIPELRISLISPLQTLQSKDAGSLNKLLTEIQLAVWSYRGRGYLKNHLNDLRAGIEAVTTPYTTPTFGKGNGQQLLLTKFSAYSILREGISEIKNEIHSRFNALLNQVDRLKQAKQYKTFVRGVPGTRGQVVTHIKDFSYFRWASALNRKIQLFSANLQKTVYRTVEAWLNQSKISPNPYCLAPYLTGVTASMVIEQMEEIISRSRNFYGGFKTKEAKQKTYLLLKEQEQKLCMELEHWQMEMEKYLRDLISPGIMPAMENYFKSPQKQENPKKRLSQNENKALGEYLAEINDIEKILNTPGGMK